MNRLDEMERFQMKLRSKSPLLPVQNRNRGVQICQHGIGMRLELVEEVKIASSGTFVPPKKRH